MDHKESPVLNHMVTLFLVFKETFILFSIVVMPTYIPTNSVRWLPFSTCFPSFIVCRFFDDGHSDWCEVILHCSFDLHFSNNEQCWTSFHVFIGHLSLEKSLFCFCFFLIGLFVFLILSYMSCIYFLEINPLSVASFAMIFSILRTVFSSCLLFLLLCKGF